MAKLLIAFTDEQETWLRKEAKARGIPVTEYLRQLVAGRMPEKKVKPRKLQGQIYETIMRGKWIFDGCKTIPDMIKRLESRRDDLLALHEDGVIVAHEVCDDYVDFATDNKVVAEKHGMHAMEEG